MILGSKSFCLRIKKVAKLNFTYTDIFPEAIQILCFFYFLITFMLGKLWFSISALCYILNIHISKFLLKRLMLLDRSPWPYLR